MSPTDRRNAAIGRLLVVLTAAGWGFGWPMMKLVMAYWPPLIARGSAGLLAAAALFALSRMRGERLAPPRGLTGRLLAAAGINVFAWMGFTALSLQWLQVAEAALLTFTMPIWATLLAWPLRGERPALRTVAALGISAAGLALLLGGGVSLAAQKLPGIAFALAAAILFAYGTVTARPLPLPPVALNAWLIGLGSLAMVGTGLVLEGPRVGALAGPGVAAFAYMAIGPMALCYLAWFAALARVPRTTAATGLLLIPVVGTVAASLVLGEPLGPRQAAALALTLGGVALELRGGKTVPD